MSFVIYNKPLSTKPEFMANEVTRSWQLDGFKEGVGLAWRVGSFNCHSSPPISNFLGRKRRWKLSSSMASDLVNLAYIIKLP